jgi:hypothetical protein
MGFNIIPEFSSVNNMKSGGDFRSRGKRRREVSSREESIRFAEAPFGKPAIPLKRKLDSADHGNGAVQFASGAICCDVKK